MLLLILTDLLLRSGYFFRSRSKFCRYFCVLFDLRKKKRIRFSLPLCAAFVRCRRFRKLNLGSRESRRSPPFCSAEMAGQPSDQIQRKGVAGATPGHKSGPNSPISIERLRLDPAREWGPDRSISIERLRLDSAKMSAPNRQIMIKRSGPDLSPG